MGTGAGSSLMGEEPQPCFQLKATEKKRSTVGAATGGRNPLPGGAYSHNEALKLPRPRFGGEGTIADPHRIWTFRCGTILNVKTS